MAEIMHRLHLVPTLASYNTAEETGEYLRVQLSGGSGRYRREYLGATVTVSCRWVLTGPHYEYLNAFYNVFKHEMSPFRVVLVTSRWGREEHTAWFMPGTFRLAEVRGDIYTVTAQLEVVPPTRDYCCDHMILEMADIIGVDYTAVTDRFWRLMNIDYTTTLPWPAAGYGG